MSQSLDAVIDELGNVTVLTPVRLPGPRRALVTVLDEPAATAERRPARSSWPERYELLRILGRGGMGQIVLARDRATHRVLCVKELFENVDRRLLQQECRALSRLSHPNIVRLVSFDVQSPVPFLVTDYVPGPPIHEYFRRASPWTEVAIAKVVWPLFDAVAYLHSQGMTHRDLKPENVIMSEPAEAAQPILIDFGLAIVDLYDYGDRLTAAGSVMGTPAYMAPEQAMGERLTPACDTYALGVLLWELMLGRQPFEGPPRQILIAKVRADSGLHLPQEARSQWPTLCKLVFQCTSPDPSARPTVAEAMKILRAVASR